jgi:hypothetical protein
MDRAGGLISAETGICTAARFLPGESTLGGSGGFDAEDGALEGAAFLEDARVLGGAAVIEMSSSSKETEGRARPPAAAGRAGMVSSPESKCGAG